MFHWPLVIDFFNIFCACQYLSLSALPFHFVCLQYLLDTIKFDWNSPSSCQYLHFCFACIEILFFVGLCEILNPLVRTSNFGLLFVTFFFFVFFYLFDYVSCFHWLVHLTFSVLCQFKLFIWCYSYLGRSYPFSFCQQLHQSFWDVVPIHICHRLSWGIFQFLIFQIDLINSVPFTLNLRINAMLRPVYLQLRTFY